MFKFRFGRKWAFVALAFFLPGALFAEDQTYIFAVQISAVVQTNPPSITLSWQPDPYGATNYIVYRKLKTDTSWSGGTLLSGTTYTYVDNNVSIGSAYEYEVWKGGKARLPNGNFIVAYGYIDAGINAPLIENRGKLILIVATNSTTGLSSELARLQSDLTGDGWTVLRHDVSSNDTPASVRTLIINDYNADPSNVNAAFLFGHVPILQSGNLNYDGHEARPMPADAYYADVDGDWSGSPDYLPSDVELMLGRVDMFDMPGVGASVAWPSETELLRNYLNKDHNWRHKLLTVQRRALMGNLRGDEQGLASSASGYRAFEPLVGPGNTIEANVETTNGVPPADRWISKLAAGTYLLAYGCGAGQRTAISGLGTRDGSLVNNMYSIDVVGQDAKAAFVMLFGSWFGNWDDEDDIMRSFLATPTTGLAACMSAEPHWFLHHMGLGETIGYSTRIAMNNTTLYQNYSNLFTRAIYISLMGDPTLRLDAVGPPSNLAASFNANTVNLNWTASTDSVLGYNLYRAPSSSGPFTRLNGSLITGTSASDTSVPAGSYCYMVRAIKLQTTPSGTYYNPSQGIFASITVPQIVPPITVQAHNTNQSILLTWNSASGIPYHVDYKTTFSQPYWSNLSGTINATGPTASWLDPVSTPFRLYRIVSP